MSKRTADEDDFGLLLKQKTKKVKEEAKRKAEEEKRKKRELEQMVIMERTVSMEDIKAKCLVSFKGILISKAEEGVSAISIKVGEHQMVGDVSVRLFERERRLIATWLKEQFIVHKNLKANQIGDTIFFEW